jgi:hypothetical protein
MTFFTAFAAPLAAYWNRTIGRKTRKTLTAELDLAYRRLERLERTFTEIVHLLSAVERESRAASSAVDMHARAIHALCRAVPEQGDGDIELYRDQLALRLKAAKKTGASHDHA